MPANQFLELQVLQIGIDVAVSLFNDKGVLLSRVSSPTGPYDTKLLFWVATIPGTLRFEIASLSAQAPPGLCRVTLRHRDSQTKDTRIVEAQRLYMDAEALVARSTPKEATETQAKYLSAISLIENTGHDVLLAQILNRYSLTLGAVSEWNRALDLSRRALRFALNAHDRQQQEQSLVNIAQDLKELGRYEDAQASVESALKEHRSSPDSYLLAKIYYNYGSILTYTAKYKPAIDYLDRAVKLYLNLNLAGEAARPLDELGFCYHSLGDLQTAMQYYQQSLEFTRRAGNRRMQSVLLDDIGRIYQQQGEYVESINTFEQSIRLAVLEGDRHGESLAVGDLAYVYRLLGQPEKAVDQYEKVMAVAHELNDRRLEENILIAIAGCYRDQGRAQSSLDFSLKALLLARSLHDIEGEGVALRMLGLAYAASSRYAEAHSAYQQALTIFSNLKLRRRVGDLLVSVGAAFLAEGNVRMAIEQTSRALPVERETEDVRGEAIGLDTLMKAWASAGQIPLAIFFGKEAVNIIQGLRTNLSSLNAGSRHGFIVANAGVYRHLADVLVAAGRLAEAQQVLDMLKEREFIEFLRADDSESSRTRATFTSEEIELDKRYREIASEIVSIATARGALFAKPSLTKEETARLISLDQDLAAGNMVFERFIGQLAKTFSDTPKSAARLVQVRESQALMEDLRELPPGTVAVYTVVGRDKYVAILLTPDVQKAYEYPITDVELNRKVLAFRQVVQDPRQDPRPAAKDLYDIMIRPIADDLRAAQAKIVMWSLDGSLRYVPLAALYDGAHYFIEQYSLSVFTPASNARLKDPASAEWKAAGFGVTKQQQGAPALPDVAKELRGIISEQPEDGGVLTGEISLDERFTEVSFRSTLLKHYPVVHIASHFRFEPGNQMNSFLLLGDGGHLTLSKVKNLPNLFGGVQLLTLSACNTGLSDEAADGSEVEGLGVLAQRKGAKAVIASLWPVADVSTSVLMRELYRIRQVLPHVTKLEALREAQLELLNGRITIAPNGNPSRGLVHEADLHRQPTISNALAFKPSAEAPYAHPFFWAPFFLMGNWL